MELPSSADESQLRTAVQDSHLEVDLRGQLLEQLHLNTDVCTARVGRTGILKHSIYLNQGVPIKQKPYRVSPPKLKVMKGLIDEMLRDNVIEPSNSPWGMPMDSGSETKKDWWKTPLLC